MIDRPGLPSPAILGIALRVRDPRWAHGSPNG